MSRQACPQCEKHWTPPGPCDNWYQGETCAYREPGPGRTMRIGSLCSGIGGLERGLERAGLGHTVWQAEIDPHASEVLARHWAVPNLGDFRESGFPDCDVLVGGFPCQPVSTAGRRAGTEDERWLFDDIVEAVSRMGSPPGLCVFENVRGLLSANGGAAMARVVHGLASVGFVGRYGLLRASDVGACHRRERVFIVARHADSARTDSRPEAGSPRGRPGESGSGPVTDAEGQRASSVPGVSGPDRGVGQRPESERGDRAAADPESAERGGAQQPAVAATVGRAAELGERRSPDAWGPFGPAIERWGGVLGRPAPPPTVDGRLSPRFVEWMMGFPEGWVDGLSRTAALRCLGNAVVPQVAELVGRMILGSGGGAVSPIDVLLPTPTSQCMDDRTHSGGNPTVAGAILGIPEKDRIRHEKAGRRVPNVSQVLA